MTRRLVRPRVGAPAPEISVLDSSGQRWHLKDQHGHHVVLIFHRHIH